MQIFSNVLMSKMGVLMSNDFNITGPQKKPHPMRCWYCQRTSPKEMTEQMSTFGPDRYIPKSGWQVIGDPVISETSNNKKLYRYKIWTGMYVMKFGYFCMQKCATVFANAAVAHKLRNRKTNGQTSNNREGELLEMKQRMDRASPQSLKALQDKFNNNR